MQGLAAASNQQTRIFTFQVDYGTAGFGIIGCPDRPGDVDLGSLQDPAYRFSSDGGSAGCASLASGYFGDSNPGWFAANAEKSRLAPT